MKKLYVIYILILFSLATAGQEELPEGSQAPDFSGTDQYGNLIVLDSLLKKNRVVVVFYRGQWCPHCNRHMSYLQDSLSYITRLNTAIVAITPEKTSEINKTIEKTEASFSIIYDEAHQIMDDYKVTFRLSASKHIIYSAAGINVNKASGNEDRALPVPAVYIINQEGMIIGGHFDTDYSVRMPIKNIIEILENHK